MSKLVRHAISVVIINAEGMVLFSKRSANKKSYPLAWSLPSHFVVDNELPRETVRRIGKEKLGVDLEIGELINEGASDRGDFTLFMHDYLAVTITGEPRIVSDDYVELKWANPLDQLKSVTTMGDCLRLYKDYLERLN